MKGLSASFLLYHGENVYNPSTVPRKSDSSLSSSLIAIMSLLVSSLLGVFCFGQALVHASATVQIQSGVLNGTSCPNVDVYSFLGIPFAQPPVGDLRFASPVAYQGSFPNGSLAATKEPPACIQFGSATTASNPQSEDWYAC